MLGEFDEMLTSTEPARGRSSTSAESRCALCGTTVRLRLWAMPAAAPARWSCPHCHTAHELPLIGVARVDED